LSERPHDVAGPGLLKYNKENNNKYSLRPFTLNRGIRHNGKRKTTRSFGRQKLGIECKKLPQAYKVTNAETTLKSLKKFGFVYDGLKLFHEDKNIVPALYGYMKNNKLTDSLFSLNYYLAMDKVNLTEALYPVVFSEYLTGNEKIFFIQLNGLMLKSGFVREDIPLCDYNYGYVTDNKKQRWLLCCVTDNGKLTIKMKLHYSGEYFAYHETLPERIKQIFRKPTDENKCKNCEKCSNRKLFRTFEGKEYIECGHENRFWIINFEPGDVEHYINIIKNETAAMK
jgi:hypothetical protein